MDSYVKAVNDRVEAEFGFVEKLFGEMNKIIVGQQYLLERLLMGILANGHILIEGVPGLAKTMSVKTLSQAIGTKFQRIQFTPDLLPADLLGTMIYNQKDGNFSIKKGPLFANLILADEINRAPSKVQSALLEAMQERQITISDTTFQLEEPFLVLATQNPLEQQGTYPLPEAQIDRFMLKLNITYPTQEEEKEILERMTATQLPAIEQVINAEDILKVRNVVNDIYIDEKIKDYIIRIIFATRNPEKFNLADLKPLISYGASPRASIYLAVVAKANAFINGRGYVIPDDIKEIGTDVLRHRLIVTYEAEAEELTSEDIIKKIFDEIEVP
ncbi:MAG: MoxR family ATPase [Candidatus Omnitrophica bacterium]|nr:MoxR family ATPase [Candidatus Omnitrophota bacterium]